ncbi:ImmA/IrrE family metallo-endopeptidase [Chitinophaga sp. Hz27]|uniref:ImmA/IrrE family metallo-endopeptidase n=1 Tax=Chitinophaga sp. Hz27 TaxID=3347169 RepID=UPI0035E27DD8
MFKNDYIEYKANKFREEHGFGITEPIDLYKLLAKLNIISVFRGMSDKFSGMAIKSDLSNFIMINSNDIKARQHFTIGHELYHLFVQENFTNKICSVGLFDKKDPEEYNADWFASYLLMPTGGIFELLSEKELTTKKVSLNTVVKMEQYFGVSRLAVLNRLMFINLISKERKEEFRSNIKRSALLMGYGGELYEPANANKVIGDYGERAKKLYDKELISETDFYNLMLDIFVDIDQQIVDDDKAEG